MTSRSLRPLTLLVMLSGAPAAGQISVGQMAPPLTFTQLLQALSGTRTTGFRCAARSSCWNSGQRGVVPASSRFPT